MGGLALRDTHPAAVLETDARKRLDRRIMSASTTAARTAAPGADGGPIAFDNSYVRLAERFFERVAPMPVADPKLIKVNEALARQLNIDPDWLSGPEGIAMLAGNSFPVGAEPIAEAYAGHQFGQFVPQLGDGRAMLIGEVLDADGRRRDIQLKGSGPTRFSRAGDGRAALGPVLREYVVGEAMAALGIPTTRTLGAVTTGEWVYRETRLPGAVLARVASSHVRIGTFQFFAARGDVDAVRTLADYVIARHYPHLRGATQPALALLEAVTGAVAELVARWMLVGFIHGVMNTDNMAVAGETIDYGPCAFMDAYHPATVFSSIDQMGRYAYANQPRIAVWNLARFAETLLPLLSEEQEDAVKLAEGALNAFQRRYEQVFHGGMRRKLGLTTEMEGDMDLAASLMEAMAENEADFTLTFRGLADEVVPGQGGQARAQFADPTQFDAWAERWRARLAQEPLEAEERCAAMRGVNPRYIPRNHRVEAVIVAAVEQGDYAPFEELLAVTARPFDEQPGFDHYAEAPRPDERVLRTFCGT